MTPPASREFHVTDQTPLPPFQTLPAITRVDEPSQLPVETVYFDTVDLALAARHTVLSQRKAGASPGWQLTLPTSDDVHRERAEPFGTDLDCIPATLLQEVRGCVRDRVLVPVARLRIQRTLHVLRDSNDVVHAVFSDDRVHADRMVPARESTEWREWEIERVSENTTVFEAVQSLILGAGARPSETRSQLPQVLVDPALTPRPLPPSIPHGRGSAAEALLGYIDGQVQMLGAQDPLVRRDEPDAVHQMRVACRRLRSVLATYRPLLDAETANNLRTELQWLASTLGVARDIQVIQERLTDRLLAEPAELIIGPIASRITEQLETNFQAARLEGLAALNSTRYFHLLDALDVFMTAPSTNNSAKKPAQRVVPRLIWREWEHLRELVHMSQATPPATPAYDLALHDVRKRAKRLRYAAETALPLQREAALRLVNAAQELQTILGDHHDSVVARDVILRLAATAQLRGESDFSYGRLHALEAESAVTSADRFDNTWSNFPKPKFRT